VAGGTQPHSVFGGDRGIPKLELCIFSGHLEHEAWDLPRIIAGGGLEAGNFLTWSTTLNPRA